MERHIYRGYGFVFAMGRRSKHVLADDHVGSD
jgi:hypothetical protein